jgi:hypothetical protein
MDVRALVLVDVPGAALADRDTDAMAHQLVGQAATYGGNEECQRRAFLHRPVVHLFDVLVVLARRPAHAVGVVAVPAGALDQAVSVGALVLALLLDDAAGPAVDRLLGRLRDGALEVLRRFLQRQQVVGNPDELGVGDDFDDAGHG